MRQLRGLSIAVCVCICVTPVAAIVGSDISAAHERLLNDASYQFDFSSAPEAPPAPGWLKTLAELIAGFFDLIGPVIAIVFWLGVALIAAGALYFIGREIWLRTRRANNEEAANAVGPTYQPTRSLARALLEEADRLAAEGRYGEAIHILLFRSIEDIQRYHPNHVRKAMTSREISHLSILSPHARSAFSRIASAVERSHFAGRQIEASIFSDCRSAYSDFAEPRSWS